MLKIDLILDTSAYPPNFFQRRKRGKKKKEIRVIDLISILNSMIIKYNNNK